MFINRERKYVFWSNAYEQGNMLVFTLKNLIVRTKSISIINECGVVNDLLFN